MTKPKILTATLSVAALLGSAIVLALPDARSGNPLSELGIETPEGVGQVVRDHEHPNTLYVGPANVKEIQGVYSELGGGGPSCANFINLRNQAYLAPVTTQGKEDAYDAGAYVSNYFQITYALPRKNWEILDLLKQIYMELSNLGAENQAMIENYLALNLEWTDLATQISQRERDKDDLFDQYLVNITNCILSYPNDQAGYAACIQDNAIWFSSELQVINARLDALYDRKDEISADYFAAKAEHDAYEEALDNIKRDREFYDSILAAQSTILLSAWNIEKEIVREEATKIVGRATVGYSLYDDEVVRLSNALIGHGNFEVKQLDAFNVSLNAGVNVDNISINIEDSALFSQHVFTFPADTLMNIGVLADWQMPFEREEIGDTIHFDTRDSNSFAAGGFDFYVTKDARCGAYGESLETVNTITENGETVSWTVVEPTYEPAPNQVVFSQSIGLGYNYYAYPGPLRGYCSINVDRMYNYWRNAGSSKKWRWFKTTTTSWETIREEANESMGMYCELDLVPQLDDPEEALALAEAFEQHMYNDMWQMFLAVYAEEYTIEPVDPVDAEQQSSNVGGILSTGLMQICGANIYCQFGGVVLKALDALGGSKAQGTTSVESNHYGTIWKRYNKDSFAVKQGNSVINLKVCVDPSQCD